MTDAELAAEIASDAGEILLALQAGALTGRELGAAGDRAANAAILGALRRHRPADAVLSEEEKDDPARLAQVRVWIVDPLDGTREYAERRADWAVHVALAVGGRPAVGAVALPAKHQLLRSDAPVTVPPPPAKLRMVVSRSRAPAIAAEVAAALGAGTLTMGSAGAKAMAVIRGEADIYLHAGGQHEWDNCAPAAVALAHGLHASRLDGAPLAYNRADTWVPDLLICRRRHAARILAAVRDLT